MVQQEKPELSWLEELFPGAAQRAQQTREKALVVAQKYLVFSGATADPRARDLLEQWTATIRRVSVPKNASAQEYAAVNALREWVEGIHAQIELAKTTQGGIPDWLTK